MPKDVAVQQSIEEFEVDGVKMVFQNTPNIEAPLEMNTKFRS
jgi:alkyl sulfatase BDS1-like metallo-beta-lactamase superfamily hydrolase